MNTNIIAFAGVSVLVLFVVGFASIFEIRLASAQVDATSSAVSSADRTTTPSDPVASTSTALVVTSASATPTITASSTAAMATSTAVTTAAASTSPVVTTNTTTAPTNAPATSTPTMEPPPQGLTLVHIVGTKYTDYFTDGTSTVSFPGDPAIDSHFSEPNAPIPTHEGMTWVHTTGGYLYDTPGGNLEVGDYAVQPNNSYIENAPPFVSSTSTAPTLGSLDTSSTSTSSVQGNFPAPTAATDTTATTTP